MSKVGNLVGFIKALFAIKRAISYFGGYSDWEKLIIMKRTKMCSPSEIAQDLGSTCLISPVCRWAEE